MDGGQFTAQRAQVNETTESVVLELWESLGSWRDNDAADFVAQAVPIVQAGQSTVSDLTAIYVAERAEEAFGDAVAAPDIPLDTVTSARGVPAEDVYRRPFTTVYTALSQGRSLADAVDLGRNRLSEITDLDLQRTYSVAADRAMNGLPSRYRPQFFQRVTTGGKTCAKCVVASTQRYRRGNLSPIHRKCDCRVEPLYNANDQVIAPGRLEAVHQAVADLTGRADRGARNPDYSQIVVDMTAYHGELGPMLVNPRDRFTGPGDI